MKLVGCSAFRQIAREAGVSKSTVQRQTERLGRHCLLLHERLRPREPERELVLDGFRSFEHSQYWPMDLNLLVGTSHFIYGFSDAPLRRSGTMTPTQREKRASLERRHGRPDPRATERSVKELLGRVVPPAHPITLQTDEHQAYPRAVRQLRDRQIAHASTTSKAARTPRNPLFPVNQADHLLRHSSANHKRETIAFSKRRQGALYRLAIHVVWRNYMKHTSENRRDGPPAQGLDVIDRALSIRDVLKTRLFVTRFSLSSWMERCHAGRIETRALATNRTHEPKLAV
jgi:hypothetical protein